MKGHEIARACSSFLRKTGNGKFFEFAHFSVREYLEGFSLLERSDLRPYHISGESIRDAVACQCLRFLQLKRFDHIPCQDSDDECEIRDEKDEADTFYHFAASSWPMLVHSIQDNGSRSSEELLDLQKLMLHPRKSNRYLKWLSYFCTSLRWTTPSLRHANHRVLRQGLSTLHVAAALNLIEVGTWLLGLEAPITTSVQAGSLLEFSVAGIFALEERLAPHQSSVGNCYLRHPRYSLADELSSRGETLSTPSEAFKDRKLMEIACRTIVLNGDFLPLGLLLSNGWKLCSEDISIARNWWKGAHILSLYANIEDPFLDFVEHMDTLGIHNTQEGHKLCALAWDMAIVNGQSFVANTSLLPSSITLSEQALAESIKKSLEDDNPEALRVCEQDPRFNINEWISESGEYAVHIAARRKSWQVLHYLIDTGCELGKPDSDGYTLLHKLVSQYQIDRHGYDEILRKVLERPVSDSVELFSLLDHKGQTALDLAVTVAWGRARILTLLLDYYPKHLGCCHGKSCIWDQAISMNIPGFLQALVDIEFPRHPDYADGRPFHLLHPRTDMHTFDLLHALYPTSLDNNTNGNLALEGCLRRWAKQQFLKLADMDVEVIRAFLRYGAPLSPTSSGAIDFCCHLVSDFELSEHEASLKLIQPFLEHGLDVQHKSGGKSILETAFQSARTDEIRHSEVVINILKAILSQVDRRKLNILDANGDGILHTVCTSTVVGVDSLINELVERGSDINLFRGKSPCDTPLIASLDVPSEQSSTTAQTLLKLGANPALAKPGACDAAQMATLRGKDTFLRELLLYLTDTSTTFDWERRCSLFDEWEDSGRIFQGLNSLHLASVNGHKDCFDFFLDNDLITDIHATSEQGFGCLHFATFYGNTQMIDYLLDLGLDVDQAAADGSTPLHVAVRKSSRCSVETLMNRGSSVRKDIIGMTPMMYARKLGLTEIIETLGRYDAPHADVENPNLLAQNARNKYWGRALQIAIWEKDVQLCTQMMEEGCPVDLPLPGCGGCSPLLMSIDQSSPDNLELVRLFLDNSASVCKQACSRHGSFPALFSALRLRHLNCFLPRFLDLCLQESSESVCREMLLAAVNFRNTEALAIIIEHVRRNESDYA